MYIYPNPYALVKLLCGFSRYHLPAKAPIRSPRALGIYSLRIALLTYFPHNQRTHASCILNTEESSLARAPLCTG